MKTMRVSRSLSWGFFLLAACSAGPVPYETPESVLYDPDQDVCFVSNIHGSPAAKDGVGSIGRLAPDGAAQTRWIESGRDGVVLNAPKGLGISGDTLWVADIDVVRRFDRHTGKPLGEIAIPGATFLNDVAVAPDGTVYCSDSGFDANFGPSGTDAIWRVTNDGAAVLAKGVDLGQPNGLFALDTGVYVVSWRDGTFFQIDTKGRRTDLGKAPTAQLDGLVRHVTSKDGVAWFATSWAGSCVYRFDVGGGCVPFGPKLEQPADLGIDEKRGRLLIPLFGANRVEIVPL